MDLASVKRRSKSTTFDVDPRIWVLRK